MHSNKSPPQPKQRFIRCLASVCGRQKTANLPTRAYNTKSQQKNQDIYAQISKFISRPKATAQGQNANKPKNRKQNKTDNAGHYKSKNSRYCPAITQNNQYCPKRGLFVQQETKPGIKTRTMIFAENPSQTKKEPAPIGAGSFIKPLTISSNGLSQTR